MKKIISLLATLGILLTLAPYIAVAESITIDPTNVGNIVMNAASTMTFGTTGVTLSAGGLSLNGASTSAAMYVAIADQILAATSDVNVFNTVASGYIGTTTLPANFLTLGKQFTVSGYGVFTTPALNTATANLKIAMASTSFTSVIASVATPSLIASASGWQYHFTYTCTVRTTGAAGTIRCDGTFFFDATASGTEAQAAIGGLGTINTTVPLEIRATNAWSTIAGGQSATEKQTNIIWNN